MSDEIGLVVGVTTLGNSSNFLSICLKTLMLQHSTERQSKSTLHGIALHYGFMQ